jgi:hypothetical protein
MKKYLCLVLVLGVVSLAGCKEKVYDQSYYKDHVSEAKDMVLKCKSGDVSGENCNNSKQAILSANMSLLFKEGKEKYSDDEKSIIQEAAKIIKG